MLIEQISLSKRLESMVYDVIFMPIVVIIFSLPLAIYVFKDPFNDEIYHSKTFQYLSYPNLLATALYFCKDCLNGQSFAKRKLKLQIVDISTGEIASPIKCFIRNVFCILWPLEALIALKSPHRRIGDVMAGTQLITFKMEKLSDKKNNYGQIALCIILAFAINLCINKFVMNIYGYMQYSKLKYLIK